MLNDCIEFIQQGYTLVTASNRQARLLRHQFSRAMLATGKTIWPTPAILPWQSWLIAAWEEQQFAQQSAVTLLNTAQQRQLWQSVIESSTYAQHFLQINPVVQQAIHTWEVCQSWQIPIFPEGVYLNEDARAFRAWARQYQTILNERRWVDSTGIIQGLLPEQLDCPGLIFYGFDEYTPEQQQLITQLQALGTDVVLFNAENRNRTVCHQQFGDSQEEIRAAAHWARQIIGQDNTVSVGIVVPDLHQRREQVVSIFEQVFHPGALLGQTAATRLYSLAPGRPLSDYPMIHAAVELLALGHRKHSMERLGELLRTVFIRGSESEQQARAQLDAALRRSGEQHWQLSNLLRYSENNLQTREQAPLFLQILQQFQQSFQNIRKRQSPGDWASVFTDWLKLFGWPGERQPDSEEYQTLSAWRDALADLATLNNVLKQCDYSTALFQLGRILADTSFQPETAETPIQICGLPGAAGMQYDYIRVIGIHDQVWPEPAKPNPFIPATVQREAKLPGATAAITLAQTRRLADQLIRSSYEIVFSFTAMQGEQECRPSPVLRQYPVEQAVPSIQDDDYKQSLLRSASIETLDDGDVPLLVEGGKTSGGSSILSDQAACSFRAFARHRLHAQGIAQVDIGLDPMVRGQLVHAVMQQIWQQLHDYGILQKTEWSDLQNLVSSVVNDVLKQQAYQQPETFTRQFVRMETQRLTKLALDWLQHERLRIPFKVLAIEQEKKTSLSGLGLRLRIDRIDQLEDGRLVILDYKTGNVKLSDWDGERMNAPQLPLYAICSDGEVAALAWANLKKGQMGFTGLGTTEDLLPGVKAAVDKQTGEDLFGSRLHQWESILADLATEFVNGHADVSPKDANACRNCDLHSLCRIHELSAIVQETEDEE